MKPEVLMANWVLKVFLDKWWSLTTIMSISISISLMISKYDLIFVLFSLIISFILFIATLSNSIDNKYEKELKLKEEKNESNI